MRLDSKPNGTAHPLRSIWLDGLAFGLCLLGCEGAFQAMPSAPAVPPPQATSADRQPSGVPLADMLAPYPRGRWRLAPRAQLVSVRIWASHILIRHRDVTLEGAVFGPPFAVGVRSTERTRAEAREHAQRVAEQAQAAPELFAELARSVSDDRVAQTTAGSLGALHGVALLPFPQVLDAFAALRPGEVSHAVETDYGFHIFQLRALPPERTFNAAHIVIGHDEAPWLAEHLARGPVPRRSRADALALATSLYQRAQAEPLAFAELAARHSEHLDAVNGGDFGAWSTRDPGPYGRELELLHELPIHGVAPPIDTLFGIEIVQRTPDRHRERFAMEMIRLAFDPAAADPEPTSKAVVFALATGMTQQLSTEPQRFSALQAEHCCVAQPLQWTERQEPTLLAFATERLSVGEIAAQPIEFAWSYAIPRRTAPELAPPSRAVEFQLPAPESVDLDVVASRTRRAVMQEQLLQVTAQVERLLALDGSRSAEFRAASQLPPEFSDEANGKQRRAAFRSLLERVRLSLGSDSYARYLELARAQFRAWTLEQPL